MDLLQVSVARRPMFLRRFTAIGVDLTRDEKRRRMKTKEMYASVRIIDVGTYIHTHKDNKLQDSSGLALLRSCRFCSVYPSLKNLKLDRCENVSRDIAMRSSALLVNGDGQPTYKRRELDKLSHGMDEAVRRFRRGVGEDDGPYLIADNISIDTFQPWCTHIETNWRLCFLQPSHDSKGSVYMFGDSSVVHEAVSRWFEVTLVEEVACRGLSISTLVRPLGAALQRIPQGMKEPDCAYTSRSVRPPLFPRCCLEVAYKNESLSKLVQEVADWHASGVLLSLGIKICANGSMYWVQQGKSDSQPTVKEFGPGLCKEENRSNYSIQFPLSLITEDVDSQPDFLITIDLFSLQTHIICMLEFERENGSVGL